MHDDDKSLVDELVELVANFARAGHMKASDTKYDPGPPPDFAKRYIEARVREILDKHKQSKPEWLS